MMFRVDLEVFRGPMDLLLYLVRKHEVDILDIPIALITDQYLAHLTLLEQLDVNAVGDFLEMASTLIEIKSRLVLPRADEEDSDLEDPRQELVQRLLEYKKYKDAASMLEERSRDWQKHFSRRSSDLPPRQRDLADEPIEEVELWDLVSAFGRIIRENDRIQPSNIVYDETPIKDYMEKIHGRVDSQGQAALSEVYEAGMHKSALIGVFLALLELVRHRHVRAKQNQPHGEIWMTPGPRFDEEINLAEVDQYESTELVGAEGEVTT